MLDTLIVWTFMRQILELTFSPIRLRLSNTQSSPNSYLQPLVALLNLTSPKGECSDSLGFTGLTTVWFPKLK